MLIVDGVPGWDCDWYCAIIFAFEGNLCNFAWLMSTPSHISVACSIVYCSVCYFSISEQTNNSSLLFSFPRHVSSQCFSSPSHEHTSSQPALSCNSQHPLRWFWPSLSFLTWCFGFVWGYVQFLYFWDWEWFRVVGCELVAVGCGAVSVSIGSVIMWGVDVALDING